MAQEQQIHLPPEGAKIQLTGEEIVRILQALGKGSFEVSAPIIEKIQRQVIAQRIEPMQQAAYVDSSPIQEAV